MIRIAFIAGTYQPNHCGVAHYTACLRKMLDKQAVQSLILTTHQVAQHIDDPSVLGVVNDWHWTALMTLIRAIQTNQIDILHIQHAAGTYRFERAIFLLPILLKLIGWKAPIVTTVHEYGWWEWHPRWLPPQFLEWLKNWGQQQRWWDREDGFLLTHSDAIITTNDEAERIICQRLPSLQSKLYRIPIGANIPVFPVDCQELRHKLQGAIAWPEDAQIIVFFGFLHPVKGIETLLDAFKQVLSVQPQARLLLIGGVESLALPGEEADRYWQKLQGLIAKLDLTQTAFMTGFLEAKAVSHALIAADIGVLPFNHGVTLKSGSLLALMSHGLPIIATRADPADPVLENNALVRLIPPRDRDTLVTQILELLNNSELRCQLAETGRNFSDQFNWTEIAKSHLNIYQTLLETGGRRSVGRGSGKLDVG